MAVKLGNIGRLCVFKVSRWNFLLREHKLNRNFEKIVQNSIGNGSFYWGFAPNFHPKSSSFGAKPKHYGFWLWIAVSITCLEWVHARGLSWIYNVTFSSVKFEIVQISLSCCHIKNSNCLWNASTNVKIVIFPIGWKWKRD